MMVVQVHDFAGAQSHLLIRSVGWRMNAQSRMFACNRTICPLITGIMSKQALADHLSALQLSQVERPRNCWVFPHEQQPLLRRCQGLPPSFEPPSHRSWGNTQQLRGLPPVKVGGLKDDLLMLVLTSCPVIKGQIVLLQANIRDCAFIGQPTDLNQRLQLGAAIMHLNDHHGRKPATSETIVKG